MKKLLIKIFVIATTFIIMNTPLYCIPLEQLGDFRSSEIIGYNSTEGRLVSILYFQFGMVTRGFGKDIIYFYGEEDLCCVTKRNFGMTNELILPQKTIYVNIYEVNYLVNPKPKKLKLRIEDLENIQKLNLEKGKLYIVTYFDNEGKFLTSKKIIFTE